MSKKTAATAAFLQKEPLSITQWVELLEARRGQLRPFLNVITIPSIGELQLDYTNDRCLRDDVSVLTLKVGGRSQVRRIENAQGIFVRVGGCENANGTGVAEFAGISRAGGWFSITVSYKTVVDLVTHDQFLPAKEVTMKELSRHELVRKDSQWCRMLWVGLGSEVTSLYESRRASLKALAALGKQVAFESKVMDLHEEALYG